MQLVTITVAGKLAKLYNLTQFEPFQNLPRSGGWLRSADRHSHFIFLVNVYFTTLNAVHALEKNFEGKPSNLSC